MSGRGSRPQQGFTLLEVLIALAIVGALVAIAFGGMRVALAAWRQGEDRAEVHQHARGIALTVARSLGAAYPYRAPRGAAPQPVLLFAGNARRIEYVTQTPLFPWPAPIAFTAVVIALEEGEEPGLVVRQRPLPNRDPFTEGVVVFRDPNVTTLEFRFLDDGGGWREEWDGEDDDRVPRAVRITVGATLGGRPQALPPLTVSLRTQAPQ